MEKLPKFVCIGAQRAGSTWLHENLKAHDGIWLPPIKELHYFDQLRTELFLRALQVAASYPSQPDPNLRCAAGAGRSRILFGISNFSPRRGRTADTPRCSRSDYLATLDNWLAHFQREQFFVGFHEEIVARPTNLPLRMYEFLGVEIAERHVPHATRQKVNTEQQVDLSPAYEYELARIHEPRLARLEKMFSPYPTQWRQRSIRVLNRRRGAAV